MKIGDLQPQRDRFVFDTADAIVAFAAANGQQVHGHTLAWCEDAWLPAWLTDRSWTRAELLVVLKKHIDTVMAHFRGRVTTWDVANEAFNPDGSVRDCLWSRTIGADWVEQALRFARAADPGALLFFNEVHADAPNDKFAAVEAMVNDFRARGVPLDGVGLQMHTVRGAPAQDRLEQAYRPPRCPRPARAHQSSDVPTWYLGRPGGGEADPSGRLLPARGRGLPGAAGLLPDHHLGLHRSLHLARNQQPAAALRRRVRARAGMGCDSGAAARASCSPRRSGNDIRCARGDGCRATAVRSHAAAATSNPASAWLGAGAGAGSERRAGAPRARRAPARSGDRKRGARPGRPVGQAHQAPSLQAWAAHAAPRRPGAPGGGDRGHQSRPAARLTHGPPCACAAR